MHKPSRAFWTAALACASFTTAAAIVLLFPARIADTQQATFCVEQKEFGPFRILENCDSHAFVRLAQNPQRLLHGPDTLWQSRPGYPALGHALSLPFRFGNAFAERLAVSRVFKREYFKSPLDPYYSGYILFNWLALFTASIAFVGLSKRARIANSGTFSVCVVLVINGVTKAFFWTPHLQILNVLLPVICIVVCYTLRMSTISRATRLLPAIGFLSGLGGLIYGASILVPAAATTSVLTMDWKSKRSWIAIGSAWIGFAMPLLLWRGYVIGRTGSFYMHETAAYHQFVWVIETARVGVATLLEALGANLVRFASTSWSVLAPPLVILGLIHWFAPKGSQPKDQALRNLEIAVAAFIIVAVPFIALMGFYAARISWELIPPILVLAAIRLDQILAKVNERERKYIIPMIYLVSIGYVFYILRSDQTVYLGTG